MPEASDAFRSLPPIDRTVRALADLKFPRPLVVDAVRRATEAARATLARDASATVDVAAAARAELLTLARGRLRRVINATGVVLHTNLGRAPLGEAVAARVADVTVGYSNLEFDLDAGNRGGRGAYAERLLATLCGGEAAAVVNNCAAALVLILHHFASRGTRRAVVVSRGELVQIGGGFRVPEILEASGATLREVGTTNRTTADDYRRAIDADVAMILRVHRSNFYVGGFTEDATDGELAAIAKAAGVPFVADLGSGATFDTGAIGDGVEREPTPAAALAAGADLLCVSGDKLLGASQAGIILGTSTHVAAVRRDPLFRALRCDKLALAALEATAERLLDGDVNAVPARRMLATPVAALRARAEAIAVRCGGSPSLKIRVVDACARVGGGTMPRTAVPSIALRIELAPLSPDALAQRLRESEPPIIGHVADGGLLLDLRTVSDDEDERVVSALLEIAGDHAA